MVIFAPRFTKEMAAQREAIPPPIIATSCFSIFAGLARYQGVESAVDFDCIFTPLKHSRFLPKPLRFVTLKPADSSPFLTALAAVKVAKEPLGFVKRNIKL